MIVRDIKIKDKIAKGIEIPMPNAPLVLVIAEKGYLMCGYLNIQTSEKLGDCACVIKGVKNIDELLKGIVVELTEPAKKAGIKTGMIGLEALSKMI